MKKYLILGLVLLVIGAFAIGVLADQHGQAGRSNIAHLYLYQKKPDIDNTEGPWLIVEGGAWGKMTYNLSGSTFDFVFNGHGLVPGTVYTLIYYPDPWPGTGLICLGSGTADDYGDVHIEDSVEINTDLPTEADENYLDGAKIWLVPCSYVNCDLGLWVGGWDHTKYLFEGELITFDDTDV